MNKLAIILVSLVTAKQELADVTREAFDALPRLVTRRKYGRLNELESRSIRFFAENGISREEIAVKFHVSYPTVCNHCR